jgi:hypothetical protein
MVVGGAAGDLVKERGDERRDVGEVLFEGEMTGGEGVQLGVGQIGEIGAGPGFGEEGVVGAPYDECWRLVLA